MFTEAFACSTGAFVKRSLTLLTVPTLGLGLLLLAPSDARAQNDDPSVLNLAQPDFTLIALPTSLRLPKFKSAFRVTHRFTRPLGQGDFGDLAADLFGIDSGAQIGLEYRFGIVPNGEIGILRPIARAMAADLSVRYDLETLVEANLRAGVDAEEIGGEIAEVPLAQGTGEAVCDA